MKNSIKSLVASLKEEPSGGLTGGFLSIRGGRNLLLLATNDGICTNSSTCTSTNNGGLIAHCNNSGNCSGSTNDSWCNNSGTCPT